MSSNSTAADALFQQAIKKYEFYVDQYNELIAVERLRQHRTDPIGRKVHKEVV